MTTGQISKPIRIGMVCPYSLSIPGGVQAQVLGLAAAMRERGNEVRVLAPCDGPPPESYVTPLGDSLPTSANGSIAPVAPDVAATLRTIRCLREEQFDVIHVHEPLAPGPSIATVTLQAAPLVGTFHAAGRSTMYRVFGPGLQWFMNRIDYRVTVSKDALALVQRHFDGEFNILWNGIDIERIAGHPAYPVDRPAVFFLGRHEERKGLDVMLSALADLDADIAIWVAGDGPDTADLKAKYGHDDRIQWLGRVSESEKNGRLRAASVVCAPSLHGESFGVVLAEAMAAGTPVVASALDGYRNVATDGVNALLVPPGDAAALRGAVARVLDDELLSARLTRGGAERAAELSMQTLADEYDRIYRKLCA